MKTPFFHPLALAALASMALAFSGQVLAQGQACFATPNRLVLSGAEATDTRAKLVWKRCAQGMAWNGTTCTGSATTFTHEQALNHARLNAGSVGWRLPDAKEMMLSMAERTCVQPALDTAAFPASPATTGSPLWSSTPFAPNSSSARAFVGLVGGTDWTSRSNTYPIYLVRSAP